MPKEESCRIVSGVRKVTSRFNTTSAHQVGWHPEQIKAAVRMRGTTMGRLAQDHGYTPQAVYMTLRRPSQPIEQIISTFLGVPANELWPERYRKGGAR